MKKFYSMFAFAATMLLGICAFSSCSSDDDPVTEEPKEIFKTATYSLQVVEEYFKYGDIEITVTTDGEVKTYSFLKDAEKKTAEGKMAEEIGKVPVRVAEGKMAYKNNIKIVANFMLTEEGKKLVAAASETDQFDFYVEDTFNGDSVLRQYEGTYISKLEDFLKVLNDYSTHSAN